MRAKIELIRVDNRLVHGQVGVTWVNALNIDTIVVVDDETAINVFSQKSHLIKQDIDIIVVDYTSTLYL